MSLIKSAAMFNIYAPIAGVMMWFYWVIIAGCLYLSMQAQRYRLAGEPIKARATHVTMLAIAVMSTGAFSVVITGF
jgi:hypothetical protein